MCRLFKKLELYLLYKERELKADYITCTVFIQPQNPLDLTAMRLFFKVYSPMADIMMIMTTYRLISKKEGFKFVPC